MPALKDTQRDIALSQNAQFFSLPALAEQFPGVKRLPVCLRIVLESVMRNVDGKRISQEHVEQLANWKPQLARTEEIPFVVARVILQDYTGGPLLADLAAMRSASVKLGHDPALIEPLVPVDMVVDHSVMIDYYAGPDALDLNMKLEFARNRERYEFMKWGMQAFKSFRIVPPGIGIVHQVNLEFLAPGIHIKNGLAYPDTLVGTDSHTTMINGIGVVGWGVGGIEAEAAMLGQPVYMLSPDVVGVHLRGQLREGVTATDLVLTVTEMLRAAKVVGSFVEFFGDGTRSLSVPDRATIANMAPEYGATMGFFPVDEATVDYLTATGRSAAAVADFAAWFRAQELFGIPQAGDIDYTRTLELDLQSIKPSLAGPKRPQDRVLLPDLGKSFDQLFPARPGKPAGQRYLTKNGFDIGEGDVLIAAITSCTNTSNPGVMLAAGLLAQKAVARGLQVKDHIKTSLAPGSRVVTDYLTKAGLLGSLEQLGFNVAAYGCTSCIGNAGDLEAEINQIIKEADLTCAAVLSGNRNFEARIHPNLRANYLASPPLVLAYAIAGTVRINLETDPLGLDGTGKPVFLKDIWPSSHEIAAVMPFARDPETFRRLYSRLGADNPLWQGIKESRGEVYSWPTSTYIAEPPFFDDFTPDLKRAGKSTIIGARALGIFGDSITTDHISPAGSIAVDSPAGIWLLSNGVSKGDFNSYGARRANHEVMLRGTFANVRIKNLMLAPDAHGKQEEGGITLHQPDGRKMPIYEAAMEYLRLGVPSIVFGGEEYGTGSSRDWAAKGTRLLGVKAVIARSFERIHRSNLIGMGVLALQFKPGESVQSLAIRGNETFSIDGLDSIRPQQEVRLTIHRADGSSSTTQLILRIDTPIEVEYFQRGGILPFVLADLLKTEPAQRT